MLPIVGSDAYVVPVKLIAMSAERMIFREKIEMPKEVFIEG